MTSNSRINPSMQTPPTDGYSQQRTNPYQPSVPISVYRELAAELQAAKTMVESLKSQNQQLVKQNQQLRQQVEKVVLSAQHLQQIIASFGASSEAEATRPQPMNQPFNPPEPRPVMPPSPPPRAASTPPVENPPPPKTPEPTPSPYAELVIEQEDSRSRSMTPSEGISDVSGWLLVVAILLIVLTAFGAGFLILQSQLKTNNR